MAYHEDVAMIVKEAAALREFAMNIKASLDAYDARFEEAELKARACKYPIREFRALMPSVKAKIVIPKPVDITSGTFGASQASMVEPEQRAYNAELRDELDDPNDPGIPASMRRT